MLPPCNASFLSYAACYRFRLRIVPKGSFFSILLIFLIITKGRL